MKLSEEIIDILKKAKESGEYFNPNFLSEMNDLLNEYYQFDDEAINEWIYGMWQR